MNEKEVSLAFVDWLGDLTGIPDDANHRYAYPVANVLGAPPIVAGIVDLKRTAPVAQTLDLFPQLELQQHVWVRVFECSATIMVEVESHTNPITAEAEAKTQFQQLQTWGAALEASAWADDSLGSRVPFISPALSFDYTPVFRELDDGTRGRTFVIEARIGELITAPE